MGLQQNPVEGAVSGIWSWDVRSDRLVANEMIADLFDLDRRELMDGMSIQAFRGAIHPDDLSLMDVRAREAIELDIPYAIHFRVRSKDGRERSMYSTGRCFFENGEPVHFVGTTVEAVFGPGPAAPSLDLLTDQVIAACKTARMLGDPFRVQLLETLLADIGQVTVASL